MRRPVPCRVIVFADRKIGRRGRGVAWQAHNADPRMERVMGRLRGSGSFYWANPRKAWRRACVALREPGVHQVKVETIGGREVGRLWRAAA